MGVDPIVGMAQLASNDKEALGIAEDVPIAIRAQMFKELATYNFYVRDAQYRRRIRSSKKVATGRSTSETNLS